MKKKVVEVAVFRGPTGVVYAYFTRWGKEKDDISVRCHGPLTPASIFRVGKAITGIANEIDARVYAEALQSGVGFRMVRRW